MKKVSVFLPVFTLFSLLFSGCNNLQTADKNSTQNITETPPDGYGIVRIEIPASDKIARLVMIPSISTEDTVLVTAESDGDTQTQTGTAGSGITLQLKLNTDYTLSLKLQKADSSGNKVPYMQWSDVIKLDSPEGKTIQAELTPVITTDGSTGKLNLNFTYGGNFFCWRAIIDATTDYHETDVSSVSETHNVAPGKYAVKLGIIPSSGSLAYTDITLFKIIDVYIYPGLETRVWVNGTTQTDGSFDFSTFTGYFDHSDTSVTAVCTVNGIDSGDSSFSTVVDEGAEAVLTITQGKPGQKIEVHYGSGANIPEISYDSLSVDDTNKCATLTYKFTMTESGEFYYKVWSPDKSQAPITNIGTFTVKTIYDYALEDGNSIAKALGWTSKEDFNTTQLSSYTIGSDSYTIYTKEELIQFAYIVNKGNNFSGKTVMLNKNIDLSGITWTAIGSSTTYSFKGTFDGQSYTISNLKGTSTVNGLFGYINTATIQNLIMKKVNISTSNTTSPGSGSVAAYAVSSTIQNCRASGTVTGYKYVGGIVGYTEGTSTGKTYLNDCVNQCEVTGSNQYTGGLAAGSLTGYIIVRRCLNLGTVTNTCTTTTSPYTGGIIGAIKSSLTTGTDVTISGCANLSSVTSSKDTCTGGITGYIDNSPFSSCYNIGTVKAGSTSGNYSLFYTTNSTSSYWHDNYYLSGNPAGAGVTVEGTDKISSVNGGTYTLDSFADALDNTSTTPSYQNAKTDENYQYTVSGRIYPLPVSIEGLLDN